MSAPGTKYTLVAFATAWGPQFGGINAFNFDLLSAIGHGFQGQSRVLCIVLDASPEERRSAAQANVELVSLGLPGKSEFEREIEAAAWETLRRVTPAVEIDERTVWLGHDRITGDVALEASNRGGRLALVHHMSYERYEHFAENSASAERKVEEQSRLFNAANVLVAVGPLLHSALEDLTGRDDVHCIIPGLADIEPRKSPPHTFRAFLSGRLSADTQRLKQAHLALAAFGHAVARCDADSGLPDALKGTHEPQMRLRGVDFETSRDNNQGLAEAESEVRLFVESYAKRQLGLALLPFTRERQKLFDELQTASAALMPSWHEGFGLVAWEAIAAGVPLVLSQKSGVYRLLEQEGQAHLVLPIDPKASIVAPYFGEDDLQAVSDALIQVAKAPAQWRQNAARLRQALLQKYTWPQCAQSFVLALGWPLSLPGAPIPQVVPPASSAALPALLERPGKRWQAGQGLALSQLLRAEEALVPFDPARIPFLEQQQAWAQDTKLRLALRLLTGQGGCGKTRLALELCERLQHQGWEAGLLPSSATGSAQNTLAEDLVAKANRGQGCLVVVDYAETRQDQLLFLIEALLARLTTTASMQSAPIRFLLLARSGGDWWQQLPTRKAACESLLLGEATSGPYEVPDLHVSLAAREQAYNQALYYFGQSLGREVPKAVPNLEAPHFGSPLHVQMVALLAHCGEVPTTSEALTRALLAHEQRYWVQACKGGGLGDPQAGSLLMTLATLCGEFAITREAAPLWEQAGLPNAALRSAWQALQPLFPGLQGLQGLRPDLLGEALVAQTCLRSEGNELLDAALGRATTNVRRTNTLTVLARVLRTREDIRPVVLHALTRNFLFCAHAICDAAIATPSPLTELAVLSFRALSPQTQAQAGGILRPRLLEDVLPLAELSLAVDTAEYERHFAKHSKRQTTESIHALAAATRNVSISLRRTGRIQEALATSRQALPLIEKLDREEPYKHKRLLAHGLDVHAVNLVDYGFTEPPRLPRRPQPLRGWSHEEVSKVFARGARARREAGVRATRPARIAVGGGRVHRRQDRRDAADAAELGPPA